jgi:hypothetical protein
VSTLGAAAWGRYLLLMAPYSLFYTLVDSFAVQRAVGWFHQRVPYREILPVRATAYILALVNTQLGQGGVAYYLHRKYRIPFLEITGTVIFISFVEVYQLALYSFLGAAASGEIRRGYMLPVYLTLATYFLFHLWFFSRPRGGRLGTLGIFRAFRMARPHRYFQLLLYKTPNLLAAVVVHWLALPLFGMSVPFTTLLAFLPLVFFCAALPIAAAHLGPSQAAWAYFFHGYAPTEGLVAYSLASHLTFMVLNAAIGLLFLRRAARELTGGDDAGEHGGHVQRHDAETRHA